MHGYLSADNVCSKMRTVFEHIFAKKYRLWCLSSFKYFSTRVKKFLRLSSLFAAREIFLWVFSSSTLWTKKIFPFFCNNHKTLSHLELNFELRPTVVDVRFENCGISLGWYSRITPSFRWGIFGRVTRLHQWWASKNIWWIIIRDICLDKWVA